MPVLVCPRCQRTNPEVAEFCYFDGALLRPGKDGAVPAGQLARDYTFPSGRRCHTFDEFALGCQEEWVAARDLLRQGVFQQFFAIIGRADLARIAQEAMAQPDGDIGLTTFLSSLPVSSSFQPHLDIHPRRILLGKLLVGEVRRLDLTINNQGQGHLQGTLKVAEGMNWLKVGNQGSSCPLATPREQKVSLEINTGALVAGQSYKGKLTVITNGGVVEVPVGMDLAAHPFARPPYQGVKTPREMAERMRGQPKAAVPLLENGEIAQWFAGNNWNYPVRGPSIKGVAGVQQFFEAMGLSKPPPVQLSQSEVRCRCSETEPLRFQVTLATTARKWVYAAIASDQPWLKVLTPEVSGPQRATMNFEVDGRLLPGLPQVEGKLNIVANAGQKLPIRVLIDVDRSPGRPDGKSVFPTAPGISRARYPSSPSSLGRSLAPVLAMSMAFLLVRVCLFPVVDLAVRGTCVRAAAGKINQPTTPDSPLNHLGGWLELPWSRLLAGRDVSLPRRVFDPALEGNLEQDRSREFGHYFVKYFFRQLVLWTWWLGLVLGALWVRRRGGSSGDMIWGIVAGAVAGVVAGVTVASGFLIVETVPHLLWDLVLGGKGGPGLLLLWILLALLSWTGVGALLGMLLGFFGPLRRTVLMPVQKLVSGILRSCGLKVFVNLANFEGQR